ncbi:Glutamine--fructose-6-phosphate aminotransferase (isomerizing) [Sedimentisphaera cyanobacteriorum]|uniref:Glutamine--fructose-6-phosphate aminotransferase [isomerizing] n=1 Tax=Sedimentisphaera cyanobacteriorum TaxID=1940790 RepID=A0A1Q2HRR3_9BACT|nr:glutamine--fructose-6-phosphate transaminase (isomerizing) [Sedimentisphaera cyanobacteriorum]AQQ10148.1 Glutamine--fructose-6-phosphate aminotransferase (isomerizing) [Sedimentisphaera cyanobacteriorum]
MCGIVGYIGGKPAQQILIDGLKRLEYRGYDSAGIGLHGGTKIKITKQKGRIAGLSDSLPQDNPLETVGIGHTRWATHGEPNTVNSHPHMDYSGKISVVHNGIIENYGALKKFLIEKGCEFKSDTDTEVIANLIGYFYEQEHDCEQDCFEWSVQKALNQVYGTYGLAVMCSDYPDVIVAAKKGSPLLIGVGSGENLIASDASAIVEHTKQVIYLEDDEMAIVEKDDVTIKTIHNKRIERELKEIDFSIEEIELGGYEHYMLKEIFEQPDALSTCLKGRLDLNNYKIILGGIQNLSRHLTTAKRFILTGCGTAWHACLVGEYLIERLARTPVEVEYASELRYRNPIIEEGTVVIAVSQSGETADTLAAIEMCKERGATVLGVVNVVGSTIARTTDAGVYLRVGPEIGVASTKAFTAQVAVLTMMAIELGRRRHLDNSRTEQLIKDLDRIPNIINDVLKYSDMIKDISKECGDRENWLFLGRGYNYPTALEGALKLKEISYIHAEGLPAAEMKHGPIALINDGMPAVFIATRCSNYDKIISNIEEVRARGGKTIIIANEGDEEIERYADYLIRIPNVDDALEPLVAAIPLQLLAYHCAVLRGLDVDKPRNLAKSVTVE